MIFEYTAEEKKHLIKRDKEYAAQLDQIDAEIAQLAEDDERRAELGEAFIRLQDERIIEFAEYRELCEVRRFKKLGADAGKIVAHAKDQTEQIIEFTFNGMKEATEYSGRKPNTDLLRHINTGADAELETLGQAGIEPIAGGYLLDAVALIGTIRSGIKLHLEALKGNSEALKEINDFIITAVNSSPYTDKSHKAAALDIDPSQAIRQPLPAIKTYGLMNDKVNAQMIATDAFKQDLNGQLQLTWGVNQAPKAKEQVPVYIALSYEGTEGKITKKLSAFDNAVYNAISTRFFYWKREHGKQPFYITPQEIWRTMNGKTSGNSNPSANQVKRICDSMDKMRFTRFYMDISEELKANYIAIDDSRLTKGILDTYLLTCSKVEFTTEKGKQVTGYRIGEEPILYTYNAAKNHILWIDYDLLDTSQNTSDGENVVEFRSYLLQQIQLMINGIRNSRRILYSSIYESTGIEPPNNRLDKSNFSTEKSFITKIAQEAKKDRDKISAILETWKQKGWIKDYKPVKQGKGFIGVDIELNPTSKQLKR